HVPGTAFATTSLRETSTLTEKAELKVVVRDMQQLVLKDNMHAQFAYGMMFFKSKGSIQSNFDALCWFKKAAELGHSEAQLYMGDMDEHDKLLRKDLARAVHWYGKAARQGHRRAERHLLALIPQKPLCEKDHPSPPDDPDVRMITHRLSLALGQLIGTSDIGSTYRVRYINMHRVAEELIISRSQFRQMAIQEEVGLVQPLRHSHLLPFYEIHQRRGCIYLIMELADKGSLSDAIRSQALSSW
ncbi:hypothetical protein DFQ26_000379, partial [Actinomortierella ambigua]